MTEDRKIAEKAVKDARAAHERAAKKADAAREKYRETQGEANRAARALRHALTHPALFDDDPLVPVELDEPVVTPEQGEAPRSRTARTNGQRYEVEDIGDALPAGEPVAPEEPEITILPAPAPEPPPAAPQPPPAYVPPVDPDAPTVVEPKGDTPPWAQPVPEEPVAEPKKRAAPKTPTRKVGARRKPAQPVDQDSAAVVGSPGDEPAQPTWQVSGPLYATDGTLIESAPPAAPPATPAGLGPVLDGQPF